MAQQIVDIGVSPNDGTGDQLRTAFDKCNDNFTELYTSGAATTTEGIWNFNQTDTDTTSSPTSGRFRTNTGNFATATQLAIHRTSINGIDRANTLRTQVVGDIIKCQDQSNSDSWCRFILQSNAVDNGTWFQINVAFDSGGGTAPGNNQEIIFTFTANSGGGGGGGNVSNVGTPTNGQLAQWTDATHIQGIDASSLNVAVPPGGASGEVLSKNTATSYDMVWASPNLPGDLVLIQRVDVSSAVASVDFTSGIDATYDEYELHWFNVMGSSDSGLGLQISQDGGATFKSGGNYIYEAAYAYFNAGSSVFSGSNGNVSFIHIGSQWVVSAPTQTAHSGKMTFFTPANASIRKYFSFNDAGNAGSWIGSGAYVTDENAINGLRLFADGGGNITAGTFILYGIKK